MKISISAWLSLFLVFILVSCTSSHFELSDNGLKKLFIQKVGTPHENMQKLKNVEQVKIIKESGSKKEKNTIKVEYKVTFELKEDAWRYELSNSLLENCKLYKNKPNTELFGERNKPKLYKKGETYSFNRTLVLTNRDIKWF